MKEKQDSELEKFNRAMDTLLKATPASVKAALEAEKEERSKQREAKRASSDPALGDRD
jgi:hypothetical protein